MTDETRSPRLIRFLSVGTIDGLSPDRVFEIFAAVALGVATVAAAWSGYQASLWGGVQSEDYVQASGYRVKWCRCRRSRDECGPRARCDSCSAFFPSLTR